MWAAWYGREEAVRASVRNVADLNLKSAAAVASFGMILRESPHRGNASFEKVLELARGVLGKDRAGYRGEFVDLVRKAEWLQKNPDLNPER